MSARQRSREYNHEQIDEAIGDISGESCASGYSINVGPTSLPSSGFATIATSTTVPFKGDIVRVGLNYQFH
jgi:hypothetical protein